MNSVLLRILARSFDKLEYPWYSIPNLPVVTLGCSIPRGASSYILPVALASFSPLATQDSYEEQTPESQELHYIRPFSLSGYGTDGPYTSRTVSSLMKYLNSSNIGELTKVVTSKGYTYYGDRGVIFNDQLEPLLLTAHWARNTGRPGEGLSYSVCQLLLVDRRVITNKDILSKAIVKDFIPFYRDHTYNTDTLFTDLRRYVVRSPVVNQECIQTEVSVLSDVISHNL